MSILGETKSEVNSSTQNHPENDSLLTQNKMILNCGIGDPSTRNIVAITAVILRNGK